MADFHDLELALLKWPENVLQGLEFEMPLHRRLARTLLSFRDNPEAVGVGDLAGLIRQLVRRESLDRHSNVGIEVPAGEGWPTPEEWGLFGVGVELNLGAAYKIRAREWSPTWVNGELTDALAVRGARRAAPYSGLPADPVIKQDLQIETFRSPGQAAALRAMSLLPCGQSLVIGLPTGSGKSLVFQAAAIRTGKRGELTVVVVPTTALAMDQEFRMQELLRHALPGQAAYPIAYHSGMTSEERQSFRHRLKTGEQCVVIASPEAVVGALRVTLQRAAEEGRLAWLAVDEAHMVGQWGETFRPEFQFLAASVASWRRSAPEGKALRTLLLTATLTDDGLDTLRALFASGAGAENHSTTSECENDRFHVLVAPELRVEPDYWVAEAPDEDSRQRWVIEALRHLPRPLIVYTSKRQDAEVLAQSLRRNLGLRRVALFRGGDASTKSGAANLKAWNAGDIDIVVATSAFGLGMDNSDVRAVVHACVPETVDRFYQEVGRGGRDGRASLSLWVHAPEDRAVAKRLAENRLIGLDRGWERWDGMSISAKHVPGRDDTLSVNLDAIPADLRDENEANRAWNLRTLTLMARAGLISLGVPQYEFPEQHEGESDSDYEDRSQHDLNEVFDRAVVIRKTTITESIWRDAVAGERTRARCRDEQDRHRLKELLGVKRPFNEIFAETYTLTLNKRQVSPLPFPGQCRLTRSQSKDVGSYSAPAQIAFTDGLLADLAERVDLEGLFSERHHWITYVPPDDGKRKRRKWVKQRIDKFLQRLVHGGIVEVAIPESLAVEIDVEALVKKSATGYVAIRSLSETDPTRLEGVPTELPLPRVTLLAPDASCGLEVENLLDIERPLHAIILPENVPDPYRPDRSYVATKRAHDSLERLAERWSL